MPRARAVRDVNTDPCYWCKRARFVVYVERLDDTFLLRQFRVQAPRKFPSCARREQADDMEVEISRGSVTCAPSDELEGCGWVGCLGLAFLEDQRLDASRPLPCAGVVAPLLPPDD